MKRKYFALLLAVTVVLGGCSLKKTDSQPDDLPEDTTSEEPQEEPEFLELTDEDFTKVDLNLNISEDPPPVEIHRADLGDLDFGQRMSPCKEPEYRDATIQAFIQPNIDFMNEHDNGMSEEDIESWRNELYARCEMPSYGDTYGYTTDGEKLYCIKNFDDICGEHDTVVFSVDLDTSEIKELCAHEDPVEPDRMGTLYCVRDKLIYISLEPSGEQNQNGWNTYIGRLMAIDTETGQTSELCSGDFEMIYSVSGSKIILNKNDYHGDGDSADYTFSEYDIDTGQLTELYSGTYAIQNEGLDVFFEISGGKLYRFEMDYANNTTTIISDNYKVTVDMCKNVSFRGATKDKIMIVNEEYSTYMTSDRKLYTYDLNTRECLVSSFNGYGRTIEQVGDALLAIPQNSSTYKSPFYYIMPQIGTAFQVEDMSYNTYCNISGDTAFIIEEGDTYTYYEYGRVERDPGSTKLYWFDISEER